MRILGIDQSYTRLGIAVVDRNSLVAADSIDLTKLRNDTQKRLAAKEVVKEWIAKYKPSIIVVERVRLFAGKYLTGGTATRLAAMTAYFVDVATCCGSYSPKDGAYLQKAIPVISVDTRTWKKQVLGAGNASKADAVTWARKYYGAVVNHDIADALAMATYLFTTKEPKVKRER